LRPPSGAKSLIGGFMFRHFAVANTFRYP
jgi:hypothetical protein